MTTSRGGKRRRTRRPRLVWFFVSAALLASACLLPDFDNVNGEATTATETSSGGGTSEAAASTGGGSNANGSSKSDSGNPSGTTTDAGSSTGGGGSGGNGGSGGSGGDGTGGATTVDTVTVTIGSTSTTTTAGGSTQTTSDGSTTPTTSSTTGSSVACEGSPITAPEPLEPVDGWVACNSNTAGVEGAFFVYSDGVGSTIMPDDFTSAGTEICVTGETGQVIDGDYSIWGAGIGFNFANERAWDAAALGVGGISFNITALPAGVDVRLLFTDSSSVDYCVTLESAGAQTWHFSDTTLDCWDTGGAELSGTSVISVKWQVTTNAESSHPFDFCIEDLTIVP